MSYVRSFVRSFGHSHGGGVAPGARVLSAVPPPIAANCCPAGWHRAKYEALSPSTSRPHSVQCSRSSSSHLNAAVRSTSCSVFGVRCSSTTMTTTS
ncbi:hypothetical protein RB195_008643 [Necator americanus]|uniref:Uncharacterized protein n=1 Tax=Necator americanus TaxID=51031 RepID=A0ABR1CQU2_NECAM